MSLPFEDELESIIIEFNIAREKSQYDDYSDVISNTDVSQFNSRCMAAVERATGRSSVYYDQVLSIYNKKIQEANEYTKLAEMIGVVKSLVLNIRKGYLKSLEEIIHGEVFGDFIEMAEYLNSKGYKDAAAVVAGSTLEAHLKQLCKKHGINIQHGGKPKKADAINSELAAANAYTKLDQKNITAWLGLRNDAAHGNYGAYTKEQVSLLVSSIRDFLTRCPCVTSGWCINFLMKVNTPKLC